MVKGLETGRDLFDTSLAWARKLAPEPPESITRSPMASASSIAAQAKPATIRVPTVTAPRCDNYFGSAHETSAYVTMKPNVASDPNHP